MSSISSFDINNLVVPEPKILVLTLFTVLHFNGIETLLANS